MSGHEDALAAMARVSLEGRCPDAGCPRGWSDIRCPDDHYAVLGIANPRNGGRKMDASAMVETAVWCHDGSLYRPDDAPGSDLP